MLSDSGERNYTKRLIKTACVFHHLLWLTKYVYITKSETDMKKGSDSTEFVIDDKKIICDYQGMRHW